MRDPALNFEFLSDAWFAAAETYLLAEQSQLGAPFSVSARFTDTPPHLGFVDNVAVWTLRWDGASASLTRHFDGNAEMVVEGLYHAGLVGAQYVGILAPGAARARDGEIAHMFGREAFRVRGRLSDGAWEAYGLFSDHLARHTLENPDFEHRARSQGLAGNIREMEEKGYTVIERAISDDFADELRVATLGAILPHQKTALNWMLYQGRPFERIIQHPLLMSIIDASLGRGATIGSFSAIRRGPAPGFIPLHTDYSHIPEPYPEFALTGVGVWALEDWTLESGPTWIVPGSHKLRRPPHEGEEVSGGVPITMPKGSVVFFTQGVWHWQGDRTQSGDRVTLHAHFNRGILRSLEPLRTDPQLLNRNSPRLAEMLGEHDWFEKLSAQGRDYGRLAYMNDLLAVTERGKRAILSGEASELGPKVKDLSALIKQGAERQARQAEAGTTGA